MLYVDLIHVFLSHMFGIAPLILPTLPCSYDNPVSIQCVRYYNLQLRLVSFPPTEIIKVSCHFILSEQVMLVAE